MSHPLGAGTRSRASSGPSATAVGLLVVAGIVAALVARSGPFAASFGELLRGDHRAAATEADGVLPDAVTVFDDGYPGVGNLDPDLLRALREAARDAADDGVVMYVNSGWRSPDYQDQLLHDAVSRFGSEQEAQRWVATADTSPHVSGDGVDIGPAGATAWLSVHGAGYGLCEVYANEPWHYELRPQAVRHGCPAVYADPTQDPRMQQHAL